MNKVSFTKSIFREDKITAIVSLYEKINRHIDFLLNISYAKGERKDDEIIRSLLNDLLQPINELKETLHKNDQTLDGNVEACQNIIGKGSVFFIDNEKISHQIYLLDEELHRQQFYDKQSIKENEDRLVNLYAMNLLQDIKNWNNVLIDRFIPVLRQYITELNELLCFIKLLNLSVTTKDSQIQNIPEIINNYLYIHVMVQKEPPDEKILFKYIIDSLYKMELSDIYIAKNIISNELLQNIVSHIAIRDCNVNIYNSSENDAPVVETEHSDVNILKDLFEIYKELISIEDFSNAAHGNLPTLLNETPKERVLFSMPERFSNSMHYFMKKWNDSLIFFYKWIIKELQAYPGISSYFNVLSGHVERIHNYIFLYQEILATASLPSNSKIETLVSDEKHYISMRQKNDLIASLHEIKNNLLESFITIAIEMDEAEHNQYGKTIRRLNFVKGELEAQWNPIFKEIV